MCAFLSFFPVKAYAGFV